MKIFSPVKMVAKAENLLSCLSNKLCGLGKEMNVPIKQREGAKL